MEELKRFEENNPHPDNQASKLKIQGLLDDNEYNHFQRSWERYMAVQRYNETKDAFNKRLLKAVERLKWEWWWDMVFFVIIIVVVLFIIFSL